jgi:rod shape-determining protein MreD
MTGVVAFFVLLAAVLAQVGGPGVAMLGGARAPFLLGAVLYYALRRESHTMLAVALAAGLLQDTLSFIPLGYSVVAFGLAGWIVSRFRDLVIGDTVLAPLCFGAAAAPVVTLFLYLLLIRSGHAGVPVPRLVVRLLGTGLLALAATPACFWLAGRLDALAGNIQTEEPTLNGFGRTG